MSIKCQSLQLIRKKGTINMTGSNRPKLGKWNKTQHDKFMKALQKYGKNWTLIKQSVGSRSMAQIRSHAQKLFLGMSKNEMKKFEAELQNRFSCFCKSGQNKVQKKESSNSVHTAASTEEDSAAENFQSLDQNSKLKIKLKAPNKNSENPIEFQSEKGTKEDSGTEQSICSSYEDSQKKRSEQMMENERQYSNARHLGYIEPSEYGFYIIGQAPLFWMSF